MAETVANWQQSTFTTPVAGGPLSASVVLGNDNNLRSKYNSHDADTGIHFQSSVAASRPAAGTAGRKWFTSDTLKLYIDDGASWDEAAYLGLGGGTLTGALIVSSGGIDVTGNSTITGTLGGITTLTATTLAGTLSTAAQANVTSLGTLTALGLNGNFTFSGANRTIIPGTSTLVIRNVGDSANAVSVGANAIALGSSTVNVSLGAPSGTTSDFGFPQLPGVNGTPTGTPANGSLVMDAINELAYIRLGGVWKEIATVP